MDRVEVMDHTVHTARARVAKAMKAGAQAWPMTAGPVPMTAGAKVSQPRPMAAGTLAIMTAGAPGSKPKAVLAR